MSSSRALFARLRQSFADRREFLATYETLNALSDRQLADYRRFAAEHP